MNRAFTIVSCGGAVLAVLLSVAGPPAAEASKGGKAPKLAHAAHHNRVLAHKHAYAVRHSYPRHYTGWTRYCWLPNYRCYGYYCRTHGWFYWYPESNRFLPITYLATYVPAPTSSVVITTRSNTDASATDLPPGAVALPAGVIPPMPQ